MQARHAPAREKLNSIQNDLPDSAHRPVIYKFSSSTLPVMTLNLYSESEDFDLRRLAVKDPVPQLEKIGGVAKASVFGGREPAVMVRIDLDQMSNSELSLLQVLQVFQYENLNYPAGSMTVDERYLVMRTVGSFKNLEDIGNVLVGYKDKVPIFLKDIADISLDYLPQEEYVRVGGKKGVYLSIQKMPGCNTVKVANEVKARLASLKSTLPPSVKVSIQSDQSITV
jgi:HAE1 family hydrophobic/amphiphilic exporter-1